MSLQIAAQHLASKGRGPDTMLVHMAPSEVAGLQALARAHGGTLTTNPDTGLPEAGFLKNLLPTLIGAGLMFATGGASAALTPGMIGLGVGGLETLRTGNLSKGLMAGLGAYGGAGLMGGVLQSGLQAGAQPAINAAQEAAVEQAKQLGQGFTQAAAPDFVGPQMSPELFAEKAQGITGGLNEARQAALAQQQATYASAGVGDKLGTVGKGIQNLGTESGRGAFMDKVGGTGKLLLTGGAAAAPLLFQEPKQATYQGSGPNPYQYEYDPNTQSYSPLPSSSAERLYFDPRYRRLASGGMARGGISNLGDYSDGGRLLRGPGDGVSDSIPAMIADKRPARLADGEFVVPARIVSELGNGSTEAGARKLYAMMDRIQKRRAKTVGEGKVAVNSRSEKLLPA